MTSILSHCPAHRNSVNSCTRHNKLTELLVQWNSCPVESSSWYSAAEKCAWELFLQPLAPLTSSSCLQWHPLDNCGLCPQDEKGLPAQTMMSTEYMTQAVERHALQLYYHILWARYMIVWLPSMQADLLLRYEIWRGLHHEMLTACRLLLKVHAYQKNAIACMTRTLSLRGTYL